MGRRLKNPTKFPEIWFTGQRQSTKNYSKKIWKSFKHEFDWKAHKKNFPLFSRNERKSINFYIHFKNFTPGKNFLCNFKHLLISFNPLFYCWNEKGLKGFCGFQWQGFIHLHFYLTGKWFTFFCCFFLRLVSWSRNNRKRLKHFSVIPLTTNALIFWQKFLQKPINFLLRIRGFCDGMGWIFFWVYFKIDGAF